ncbi:MAG: preprotein translocase subunit TatA [Omnitrophica bacterium RIFCSPHIGHO2_02_FULL_46_11]|nr:MAG: preprotein translocase subunit TatA [Omnitrophica bacterium RIFCSPLOWO2_01_FULL_45_10b]OGW86110.1 MAG: preprotein translocase subunit TatA [Omnitrophica bacterium RIFCSPHIGHO2_02_FULL_46_11]
MSMPGPFELLLIFLVVLFLFGGKKLPEVGRALGEGIREFKKAMQGKSDSDDEKKTKPKV